MCSEAVVFDCDQRDTRFCGQVPHLTAKAEAVDHIQGDSHVD
jgi:hypothetical protein